MKLATQNCLVSVISLGRTILTKKNDVLVLPVLAGGNLGKPILPSGSYSTRLDPSAQLGKFAATISIINRKNLQPNINRRPARPAFCETTHRQKYVLKKMID